MNSPLQPYLSHFFYIFGYAYDQGHLQAYGISNEFFARSPHEYLVLSFFACLAVAIWLLELFTNNPLSLIIFALIIRSIYFQRPMGGQVKATVRQIEQEDGCLIFDDTLQEKAWTAENEIMCRHHAHCKGCSVKGIHLLNALYYSGEVSIPVAFEVVRKPYPFSDVKTRKVKRAKNELMREMIHKLFVINTLSKFFRPRYLTQLYCVTGLLDFQIAQILH